MPASKTSPVPSQPEFQALGYDSVGPVPWSILLLLGLAGAAWAVVRYTRFGYHLYAVGGNEETARLSGIRPGAGAGARAVQPDGGVDGAVHRRAGCALAHRGWGPDGGYGLESIAAVVLGGTALAGGRGSVLGTLAGVLIFAIIDNVFNEFQVDPFLKTLLGDHHRRCGSELLAAQPEGPGMSSAAEALAGGRGPATPGTAILGACSGCRRSFTSCSWSWS